MEMERVCKSMLNRVQTADQAAQFIQSGMTVAMSGFTLVGYPKAVPTALVESGHACQLTVIVGASAGDEVVVATAKEQRIKVLSVSRAKE